MRASDRAVELETANFIAARAAIGIIDARNAGGRRTYAKEKRSQKIT